MFNSPIKKEFLEAQSLENEVTKRDALYLWIRLDGQKYKDLVTVRATAMKLIPSTGDSAAHPSGLGLLVDLRHKSEAMVAVGGPRKVPLAAAAGRQGT